jgi:hypothetical protein
VRARLILSVLLCLYSVTIKAQGEKPVYLSFAYGSDQDLEKSDRILTTHPTFLSISFEKRLPQSDFYGVGIHAFRFISVFNNYNHLSIRGYQHFGYVADANAGNFDPYIGAFVGGETFQGSFKPAVGIFVGMRAMVTQKAGVHLEFISVSSGFNSSVLLQFGITSCLMKSEFPKKKKWGNKCPK